MWMVIDHRNGVANQFLDVAQEFPFFMIAE
jgi:hypothetical protein